MSLPSAFHKDSLSGSGQPGGTYVRDLNAQCERMLWFALAVGTVVFLPYLSVDRALHPESPSIAYFRIGMTLVSFLLLVVRLAFTFPYRGVILAAIFASYLEVSVAILSALAGADPVYMAGYTLVLMLLPLAPLPRRILVSILVVSVSAFLTTLWYFGWPELTVRAQYSLNDYVVAVVVVAGLIHLLGSWRLRSWERTQRIEQESRRADGLLAETLNLAGLARRINEQVSLHGMIEQVFAFLSARFPVAEAILLALDDKSDELIPSVHLYTKAPEAARAFVGRLRIPLDESGGLLARVFHRKRPFLVRDVEGGDIFRRPYPGMESDRAIVERLELKSFLALPLVMQDRGIGMLLLTNYDLRLCLRTEEIQALGRISDQIAPAVHTALLLEQLRQERQKVRAARAEIELLNQISRRIAEADSFADALDVVRAHMLDRFGIRKLALFRYNSTENRLHLYRESLSPSLAEGAREELINHPISADPTQSVHGRVCQKRRAIFFRRLRFGSLMSAPEQNLATHLEMRAALIVPLIRENEVIGVLSCTNGAEEMRLSSEDVASIEAFCQHVAGILHTFVLLGDARAARERSERLRGDLLSLHAFARDLNAQTRYQDVVDAIYSYAAITFPASAAWLVRVDETAGVFRREPPSSELGERLAFRLGALPAVVPINREAGALFQVFRRRRIVHLNNVERVRPMMSELDRDLWAATGTRDLLYCPLVLENHVVGMLGFVGLATGSLRDAARIHLKAFCEQAAGAMQRALLAERGERDGKRMAKIGQMAASIIHDIKNPMTTIKGYAEMSDSDIGPVRRREYLERIGREVDRLAHMSYDILEFAGGRYNLDLEVSDLEALLGDVLAFKADDCAKHSIRAELRADSELILRLDRERLRRALLNLLTNAIEALQMVEPDRRLLTVSAVYEDEWAVVRFRDTGPGIDKSIRARLFEAFTTAGKAHGTGLGLSIVASIVEAHGGTIECDSEPGAWTEFVMKLPAGRAPVGVGSAEVSGDRRDKDRREMSDRRALRDRRLFGRDAD